MITTKNSRPASPYHATFAIAIVLEIVDRGNVVAVLQDVDGHGHLCPVRRLVSSTRFIVLKLPRTDSSENVVRIRIRSRVSR